MAVSVNLVFVPRIAAETAEARSETTYLAAQIVVSVVVVDTSLPLGPRWSWESRTSAGVEHVAANNLRHLRIVRTVLRSQGPTLIRLVQRTRGDRQRRDHDTSPKQRVPARKVSVAQAQNPSGQFRISMAEMVGQRCFCWSANDPAWSQPPTLGMIDQRHLPNRRTVSWRQKIGAWPSRCSSLRLPTKSKTRRDPVAKPRRRSRRPIPT